MPRTKTIQIEESEATSQIQRFLEDGRHPNPDYFTNDDRGFEDFQSALDEKDVWGEYIAYLYRVAPRRTPTDKEARVTTFVNTLTIAEITKKYGGKKWSVWMNHGAGGRTRLVKKFQFDIEAQPIWQDDETPETPLGRAKIAPGAPENGGPKPDPLVIKAFDDLIAQRDRALGEGRTFDTGEALQRALALQNKGFESALTSVTANLGKGDSALVSVVTELIKSVTTRKDDPILQILLERALQKPDDAFDKITALLTLLKELGVKIGSGRVIEGSGSEWAGVIEKLVDKAPELINNAARLVPQRGPMAPPPRISPAIAGPAAPLPHAAAGQPPNPQPPANAAGPTPAPANLPPESSTTEVTPELADRIAQNLVKGTIVRMLFAGDSGDDAAHYAELAHEPLARTLAGLLKTNPAVLRDDPILSQALTHINVTAFSKEFVDYFEEEGGAAERSPAPPEPGL